MDVERIIEQFDKYVVPNYTRKDVVLVEGRGSRVRDATGREYLDLFPGWGCNGLGHCHPGIVEAIRRQADRLIHVANDYYNELQGELAEMISTRSFGGKCFFCNSGAEAIEGAIKFARIFTAAERHRVVTMKESFHGRTLAAITATGQDKYHQDIGPLSPGFCYVPFNDIDAVAEAIDDETCAVLLELIQGEGGVNVADPEYVSQLRELCDGQDVLLVIDEVQTGCGRTGEWFVYEHYGIEPDIITLAKALGGGVAIGGIEARPDIADRIVPGLHASTFGGNPIACAAAIAAFRAVEEENLLENARSMGEYLVERLGDIAERTGLVKEIRGRGLMIGCELNIPAAPVTRSCLEKGLLVNCTHDTVLRFLPAMTVTRKELDEGLDIVEAALNEQQE